MDPISHEVQKTEVQKTSTFSVDHDGDDDGFFLGVHVALPPMSIEARGINPVSVASEPMSEPTTEQLAESESAIQHSSASSVSIPDRLYFRIGDVAELVGVKPYVLRYWESEFPMISPEKSTTGQRVYRRADVETVLLIKHLLYKEKYSIEGARKRIQQLRKEGQLKTFKQDKVYGGREAAELRERVKEACTIVEELEVLAQASVREIFRY